MPQLLNISNTQGHPVSNVDSGSITSHILWILTKLISADLAKLESLGVVVTHGSDTPKEMVFFLDLTVRPEKPVIVIGVYAAIHLAQHRWPIRGLILP
jgi:L-asparaginase